MTENTKTNEIDSEVQNNTEFSEAQKDKEYQEFKEVLEEINAELAIEEEQTETSKPLTKEEKIEQNIEKLENCQVQVEDNQPNKEQEKKDGKEEKIEDPAVAEQYKEYRLQKIFSKINYNLTSPELTTSMLNERITDGLAYGFNCFMVLTRKIKGLKASCKKAPLGAVIGFGESTLLARVWEIRQAKWAGAKEIEVIIPLSLIKEGKKRTLIKEITKYKKAVANKAKFKVGIIADKLSLQEFNFVVDCMLIAKVKRVVVHNSNNLAPNYLLSLAKQCIGKCEIEIDAEPSTVNQFAEYSEKGIDLFLINSAISVAETIKHQ